MPFIPNTNADRAAMLTTIGVESVADLFNDIPSSLLAHASLDLPPALSELELYQQADALAAQNDSGARMPSFLGAGCYDHFVPSIVRHVMMRGEFLTAYTPYQAEASQGTLQVIYEFQSLIAELTGMELANASLYDGASGLAEAVLMATAITGRNRVLIPPTVHPNYRRVVESYCQSLPIQIVDVGPAASQSAVDLASFLDDSTAALVVQQPNFFGIIEDMQPLAEAAHAKGALLIAVVNPMTLGLLKPPGEYDADIVVGEGQPLGIAMSLGGPGVGLFACKKKFARYAPGRIVGATTDAAGRRGFVLTLQTREQHIRREKATSNICTNQGLFALAAGTYLNAMGPSGLRQIANLCVQKTHYAAERIAALPGYSLAFDAPFFHEFVVRCPWPAREINAKLHEQGIIGGCDLGRDYPGMDDCMLLCVTEKRTKAEIDGLVAAMSVQR